ncbi:MAG: EF-hand domain-containing protein [Rhodospirillaceae bacterium]|nr:EF-hand domain-containing protein [Rhodospirillaceae bacterium]
MTEMNDADKTVSELEQRFLKIAGEDGVIDGDEFRTALGLKDDYLTSRLFAMVDDDASGEIELGEFLAFVRTLLDGDEEAQLRFAFRLHDPDDSGAIDQGELRQLIAGSVAQHGLEIPEGAVNGLTEALFRRTDTDESGEISFDEFRDVLDAYPTLKAQMTFSGARWLKPPTPPRPRAGPTVGERLREFGRLIANNKPTSVFLILFAAVNVALFVNAVETYAAQGANGYVQIARGCAEFQRCADPRAHAAPSVGHHSPIHHRRPGAG